MQGQMQIAPFTKTVRALVIINVAIWVVLVLILQGFILHNTVIFDWFALVPAQVFTKFWLWQIGTYMFLHASNSVFHVVFNMLTLWWFGAELEQRWGSRFFLTYYLTCGAGAGLIYLVGSVFYAYVSGNFGVMEVPLVGASGATYGLLLAYGILFGERQVFFLFFPMKARNFVMIIGAVELLTLMDSGMGSQTANLAHLGGIAVGFMFLSFVARWRARQSGASARRGRKLKLVVNNESQPDEKKGGPKYWN